MRSLIVLIVLICLTINGLCAKFPFIQVGVDPSDFFYRDATKDDNYKKLARNDWTLDLQFYTYDGTPQTFKWNISSYLKPVDFTYQYGYALEYKTRVMSGFITILVYNKTDRNYELTTNDLKILTKTYKTFNYRVSYSIVGQIPNILKSGNAKYIRTNGLQYGDQYQLYVEVTESFQNMLPYIFIGKQTQGKFQIGINQISLYIDTCPYMCETCNAQEQCLRCPINSVLKNGKCVCNVGYQVGFIHMDTTVYRNGVQGYECVRSGERQKLYIPSILTQKTQSLIKSTNLQFMINEEYDPVTNQKNYINVTALAKFGENFKFTGNNYDEFPINNLVLKITFNSYVIFVSDDSTIYKRTGQRFGIPCPNVGVQFKWILQESQFEMLLPYGVFKSMMTTMSNYLQGKDFSLNAFNFYFYYYDQFFLQRYDQYGMFNRRYNIELYNIIERVEMKQIMIHKQRFSLIFSLNIMDINGMQAMFNGYFCEDQACTQGRVVSYFDINSPQFIKVYPVNPYLEGKLVIESVKYQIEGSSSMWVPLVIQASLNFKINEIVLRVQSNTYLPLGSRVSIKIEGQLEAIYSNDGKRMLAKEVSWSPIIMRHLSVIEGSIPYIDDQEYIM